MAAGSSSSAGSSAISTCPSRSFAIFAERDAVLRSVRSGERWSSCRRRRSADRQWTLVSGRTPEDLTSGVEAITGPQLLVRSSAAASPTYDSATGVAIVAGQGRALPSSGDFSLEQPPARRRQLAVGQHRRLRGRAGAALLHPRRLHLGASPVASGGPHDRLPATPLRSPRSSSSPAWPPAALAGFENSRRAGGLGRLSRPLRDGRRARRRRCQWRASATARARATACCSRSRPTTAARFERIFDFTRNQLLIRDDGLAAWKWDPNANPHIVDVNDASDGDILIAYALGLAGKAWDEPRYTAGGARRSPRRSATTS